MNGTYASTNHLTTCSAEISSKFEKQEWCAFQTLNSEIYALGNPSAAKKKEEEEEEEERRGETETERDRESSFRVDGRLHCTRGADQRGLRTGLVSLSSFRLFFSFFFPKVLPFLHFDRERFREGEKQRTSLNSNSNPKGKFC